MSVSHILKRFHVFKSLGTETFGHLFKVIDVDHFAY